MQILVVPSAGWGQAAAEVARSIATAWGEAVTQAHLEVVLLSDGGRGFVAAAQAAGINADTIVLESAAVATQTSASTTPNQAALTGSSAPLGELLDAALRTDCRTIVIGLGDTLGHDVMWADGGAGLIAALAGTGSDPALSAGGLALSGLTPAQVPDLHALRRRLAAHQVVVAHRHSDPLLGLHGLASGLGAEVLSAEESQSLERALGDFTQAVAGAWGDTVAGRNLLGPAPKSASALARDLAATSGASSGGGVAFALHVLGAQLRPATAVLAELVGLEVRIAAADLVVVVAPALDADEVHDGVVPAVAQAALDHAIPTIVLAGHSEAGRREWSALGVASVYDTAWHTPDDVLSPDNAADVAQRVARIARTWLLA